MAFFVVIDWILMYNVLFLASVLSLNEVASFHDEAHTFLYKNS